MRPLATVLPSTVSVPAPPLPMPPPSYLKSYDDGVRAGRELVLAGDVVACDADEVVVEDRLALEQVEPAAGEAPALGDEHAFRAACRESPPRP